MTGPSAMRPSTWGSWRGSACARWPGPASTPGLARLRAGAASSWSSPGSSSASPHPRRHSARQHLLRRRRRDKQRWRCAVRAGGADRGRPPRANRAGALAPCPAARPDRAGRRRGGANAQMGSPVGWVSAVMRCPSGGPLLHRRAGRTSAPHLVSWMAPDPSCELVCIVRRSGHFYSTR